MSDLDFFGGLNDLELEQENFSLKIFKNGSKHHSAFISINRREDLETIKRRVLKKLKYENHMDP